MDLPSKTGSRSGGNSKSNLALDFLRKDKARFNGGRTPVPLPIAVIERQRKQFVNKRYKACMIARRDTCRENQMKLNDNRESMIKDLKSDSTSADNPESDVKPWPGFRYHNNGEVRTLTNRQKQRRLMCFMRAGLGHRQSTLNVPWTSSSALESKVDIADRSNSPSKTMAKGRSLDSFKKLTPKSSTVREPSHSFSLPAEFYATDSASASNELRDTTSTPVKSSLELERRLSSFRRSYTYASVNEDGNNSSRTLRDAANTLSSSTIERSRLLSSSHSKTSSATYNAVPSNRSIGRSRLNLNQFGPAVKALTTSSVWCNGDRELTERASLIPKDSFNIKFGVPSKVLHQRKSDLDEYRAIELKRSAENVKNIKNYIENVRRRVVH